MSPDIEAFKRSNYMEHLEIIPNPHSLVPLAESNLSDVSKDFIEGVPTHVARFIERAKVYHIFTNSPKMLKELLG